MYDKNDVCRTCLCNESGDMVDLFSESKQPKLYELLLWSVQIKTDPNDGLPSKMCGVCSDKLYNSYRFRKMCLESENTLKESNTTAGCIRTVVKNERQSYDDTEDQSDKVSEHRVSFEIPIELPNTRKASKNNCKNCNRSFSSVARYKNHSCERHKCKFCVKTFVSQSRLNQHHKKYHKRDCAEQSVIISGTIKIENVEKINIKKEVVSCDEDDRDDEPVISQSMEDHEEMYEDDHEEIYVEAKDALEENMKEEPEEHKRVDKQKMKCDHCSAEFTEITRLVNHNARVHKVGKRMFGCKPCQKVFETKALAAKHRRHVHGVRRKKKYVCEYCQKPFPELSRMMNHVSREHGVGKHVFGCRPCQLVFDTKNLARRHRDEVHSGKDPDEKFICDYCEKEFQTRHSIIYHLMSHGSIPRYRCRECYQKRFHTSQELKDHMAAGKHVYKNRNFICDICNRGFSSKSYISKHMKQVHSENKAISQQCYQCDKTFSTSWDLKEHAKMHKKLKDNRQTYVCPICGNEYISKESLHVHLKRHGTERKYQCQFCSKKFFAPWDKKMHERRHTADKPHLCSTCGKGFINKYCLKLHVRTHTAEKPYKCTYCDWSCARVSDLTLHIRRHTGQRFTCELCNEGFLQLFHLKNHKLAAHGIYVPKNSQRLQKFEDNCVSEDLIKQDLTMNSSSTSPP